MLSVLDVPALPPALSISLRTISLPVWKTLFALAFGLACLALGLPNIIVPITVVVDNNR
jgi:hypothetical protein